MEELKQILMQHARRYPLMEPTDAVKLVYQNEFGGGHLIKDSAACLAYLQREYDATQKDPQMPLYEEIGNGIVRVNLAALQQDELVDLGQRFLASAAAHTGALSRFLEKLNVLCKLSEERVFAFDAAALQAYLDQYKADGYPPVSHSEAYRKAYRPAYRIVQKNLSCFSPFSVYNENHKTTGEDMR